MAITLNLHEENGQLAINFDDGRESARIALGALPPIERLQADPFTHGKTLTNALGGETYLLTRLQTDPDNLILLNCDDIADSFAWEFATCADGQFLCIKAGMLRTVQRDAPPITGDGAINFIALAADPLVDQNGNLFLVEDSDGNLKEDNRRLDLDNEMKAIRTTLQNCGKILEARRIPPIREELYRALRKGPAILHLSCHGNVVPTGNGPMAVLSLEKKDGSHDPFAGSDLMNTKRGILRMILLSACKTAIGTEANLARALALNGVPMTVGMQESIDDTLSDEIATALYDSLFAGLTFGEALQQARQNISQRFESVGLLVGYVVRNRWKETLPLRDGTPMVGNLGKPGIAALGGEIQPPRPLLGRNLELHQLAKLFTDGQKVITVAGTGGMGKTALAAAFAERFAWMWSQGVRAYSFANEVNFASFINALMRTLYGNEAAIQKAELPDNEKRQAVLDGAREWDGLWLFDNYESIMQGLLEGNTEAERIHRLIGDLANGGAALLLTSREQPAGLKNERLFPEGRHLAGLREEAGVTLFFQHSVKAKKNPEAHIEFALQIQHAADGHPLAIALLAGEYDTSAVSQSDFLQNWQDELASARRASQMGHHVTFTTAFERSYSHLSPDLKLALTALSIFSFSFFAKGFVVITGELPADDKPQTADDSPSTIIHSPLSIAKQTLNELARRSLLEVDGWYEDDTPATYRFQPALRQEAERRVDEAQKENQRKGYAEYAVWFVNLAWNEIDKQPPIVRLALASLSELINLADHQPDDNAAHYCWQLGTVLYRLGFPREADEIQKKGADIAKAKGDDMWRERILFQQARLYASRGDLETALNDFEECARLAKAEKNEAEYSVVLNEMADIHAAQGDLDRAFALNQESLQIKEQLGDKKGKAASLHRLAQFFLIRGDLDRALALYQESLKLLEQLGDKKGKAASLHETGRIYSRRGDLDRAIELYQESLQLKEQVGDIQGKAASLGQMANIFMERQSWDSAEKVLLEALELVKQTGEPPAFEMVQLGQVAQARGDKETALARYREGLAFFERIGMPRESQQVRELIANLESGASLRANDPLAQAIAQARSAAEHGDVQSAIQYQEQAVELARGRGEEREAMVSLSLLLYNLAGYYQEADRYDDAVKAMEEVVAIDEQTGHQDLESDRKMLETFRRIASLSPEERAQLLREAQEEQDKPDEQDGFEAQLQAQLAQLPPEQRSQAEAQIRKAYEEFQHMSPQQQAAVRDQGRRAKIDNAASQARDAGLAYARRRAPRKDIIAYLNAMAQKAAEGEELGSPWLEVAALCNSLMALIKDEPIPPVPAKYVAHFSAVQQEMKL